MLQVFQRDLGKHNKSAFFFLHVFGYVPTEHGGASGESMKHGVKLLQENKCNNFQNTENMR